MNGEFDLWDWEPAQDDEITETAKNAIAHTVSQILLPGTPAGAITAFYMLTDALLRWEAVRK